MAAGDHPTLSPIDGRVPAPDERSPELSVVVPAYNSARYIGATVDKLARFLDQRGIRGEIVVVDDGSADDTAAAAAVSPLAIVVRQERNRGKGAALRAGMARARGDVRAFTDADLPYGTEPLDRAMHYITERRFHAVLGDRTLPGSTYADSGPLRAVVSELSSLAFRTLVTGGIYDTQCGIKAFRGDVAAELFRLSRVDGFAIDVELIYLLLKYRLDIKRFPVQLLRNSSSSVRVVRDSWRAFVDIGRMRRNWAVGRYRSPYLVSCLVSDMEYDEGWWRGLAAGDRSADELPAPSRVTLTGDGSDDVRTAVVPPESSSARTS